MFKLMGLRHSEDLMLSEDGKACLKFRSHRSHVENLELENTLLFVIVNIYLLFIDIILTKCNLLGGNRGRNGNSYLFSAKLTLPPSLSLPFHAARSTNPRFRLKKESRRSVLRIPAPLEARPSRKVPSPFSRFC
jgi:hypothetical protein